MNHPVGPEDAGALVAACADEAETYDVLAIHQGSWRTMRSHVFLNHDLYAEPDGHLSLAYSFWVLRSDRRTLLVDTGMSEQGARSRGRGYERSTTRALSELGISPSGISQIVLSHAHYDHAGGLRELRGVPVWMSAAEREFWRTDLSRRELLRSVVDDEDIREIDRAEEAGEVRLLDGVTRIAPGVLAVPAPGHTPGELIVLVNTARGVVVLACDAAHLDEEIARDMPFRHQTDLIAMYRSLALLRALGEDAAVCEIVTGHDEAVRSRHPSAPGLPHVAVIAAR